MRAAGGWRGRPRARQEGATTALCPSPACSAPSGGPKGSGLGRGGSRARAVPFGTERGAWGKGRSQGSEPCWGRGGATPWEKGLGTSRMDQSASKARVASRGSFGQWEGRTLRRFGGRKEKKKPHETTIESVWGLERLGVGVVYSRFQRLPSPLKGRVVCITPGPRGAHGAE